MADPKKLETCNNGMDRPFNHVASFVGLGFDVLE